MKIYYPSIPNNWLAYILSLFLTLACLTSANAQWTNVGNAGFSGNASYQSMKFHPITGEPYVAYTDNDNSGKTTVMRYTAGAWVVVGIAGFSPGFDGYQSLAFHPTTGEPYVAYAGFFNAYKTSVMRFTSGVWQNVGTAGFSAGTATYQSLAFHPTTGEPYVAYRDEANANNTTVMRYTAGAWAVVGIEGFSAGGNATYQSLAFHPTTGEPHVAYRDGGNGNKTSVMSYRVGAWALVGIDGFSVGNSQYQSLAFHPITGEPYVAYRDVTTASGFKTTVMRYTAGAWAVVGIAGFSTAFADFQNLAFHPTTGEPYVAYRDDANGGKTTVMRYTAGAWAVVGMIGFSAGNALSQSLAFHPTTGEPYVAYKDNMNGNKTTVMRFPLPNINLMGNGISIPKGDITPSGIDHTDFGLIGLNTSFVRTFAIRNTGNATLNISSISNTNTTDYTVSNAPTSIVAGGSATFMVTLNLVTLGTKTATITINSDDIDDASYTFAITGKAIFASPATTHGNMLNFDGIDGHINVPANAVFDFTDNFSVEAWVKISNTTGKKRIIHKNGWAFGINGDRLDGVIFGVVDFTVSIGNPIAVNTWTHIAFVVQNNNLTYYINGIASGGYNTLNLPATAGIGIDIGFNGLTNDEYFKGNMDEVRIWNVARTQAQIRESMHLTLSGGESGLVAYYQFNESTGNAIEAIRGNNGTLIGGATRTISEVAVATGTSQRTNITTGLNTFASTSVAINFTTACADEFVVYQLKGNAYNGISTLNTNTVSYYWIVRQFGSGNIVYDGMNFTIPNNNIISTADQATPSNLKLYKRPDNATSAFPASFASATSANNNTKIIQFTSFTAQTSFSQFEIGSSSSPLPITLLSFEGKRTSENDVLLDWKTATEINNKGFDIEISKNAVDFTKIAFVDGKGNSNVITNYELEIGNGENAYYRLKQIDFNGAFSYSNIIFVKGNENTIKIYPNPTTEKVTIGISDWKINDKISFELFDLQGKPIAKENINTNKTVLNIENLQKGIYILQIIQNVKRTTHKIVVY